MPRPVDGTIAPTTDKMADTMTDETTGEITIAAEGRLGVVGCGHI